MIDRGIPLAFALVTPLGPDFTPRVYYTLRSLRAQKEIVRLAYCDVGGSAESRAVAAAFPDLIAYRRHGPDGGQSAAINEGWRNVEGEIYGWLNADDYLAPDALERVASIFRTRKDIDVVYGQSFILDGDQSIIGLHPAVDNRIDRITRHNLISQPSCFYRAAALDAVGPLREDLHYTMDWDLWARLYMSGAKFHYTPTIFSSVLWERGTKTSSLSVRRLNEIAKLTATYEAPLTVAKTLVGFGLHHAFEYSSAAPVLAGLRQHFAGTAAARANMWRSADHADDGDGLTIYHFMDKPAKGVRIHLESDADLDLEIDSAKVAVGGGDKSASITTTVEPSRIYHLRIQSRDGGMPEIRHIEFLC